MNMNLTDNPGEDILNNVLVEILIDHLNSKLKSVDPLSIKERKSQNLIKYLLNKFI